ncbi:hypothetical protein MANES_18G025260v8 [Manihot esculenta]|uniref:Uncharacterized protein n=1 Tax=Manihot esculenta TaxID=3983 RepID=A0ACB7G021_MANES|nr:hypothetical protein MANES_18G025260v8 [Manihot esculenta]
MERAAMVPLKLLVLLILVCVTAPPAMAASLANPVCQDKCGDVNFYFTFGVGEGCYMNKSFEVVCNDSFTPPKPFLKSINMELLALVSSSDAVLVNNPVIHSDCGDKVSTNRGVNMSGTATGCDNYAMLVQDGETVGGCLSICRNESSNTRGCYGLNCCQATIPPNIQSFEANMTDLSGEIDCIGRKSAFMVHQDLFDLRSLDEMLQMDHVPARIEWAKFQGNCDLSETITPYINCTSDSKNCQDDSKCTDGGNYNCDLFCMHTPGGYDCPCPTENYENISNICYPSHLFSNQKSHSKFIIIGCASGLGFLLLLIGLWLLYKLMKRRHAMKLKQKFFKRNGGLLLQQQLSSEGNNVEQTKLFACNELENATDHYHENRILGQGGQGGQGTVYKGMLTDGRVVAIKKSKVVDEDKLEQFINEVLILSQINHRNVVKLLGCCLGTEVPLLVYEFIPNGTLFQYIHNQNEELPLTWEMRLRIATEVAGALSYLHSAASLPIYHRDIKSSNILLDDKFRAKVADFGTSKSISIDQTHVTTRVQGTFGYLDPEYFQSSQFTEKSDVYSFGVVIIELLTGQKPISPLRSVEARSLATYFLDSMEANRLFEIVDVRVLKEGGKEEIIAVAKLAKRCLDLSGKKRPSMKTVAMELEGIRASQGFSLTIEQDQEEVDFSVGDYTGPWDVDSSSTGSLNSVESTVATIGCLFS